MKKLKLLTLLPAICLSSCSGSSPYGVYEFRLGKTDGSHIGLSVELLDEINESHKDEDMRNMKLTMDLGSEFSLDKIAEQITDDPVEQALIEEVLKLIKEAGFADNTITGYYKISDIDNPKYGRRVRIGSDFLVEAVTKLFPELADFFKDLLTPEMIEKAMTAYINKKQFTLQLPVSLEDAQYQLAWYGILVDTEGASPITYLNMDDLPGPKGEDRYGVHPTVFTDDKGEVIKSEVEIMNETFEYEFSRMYLYDEGIPVGSFIIKKNDKDEQVLYFKPFEQMSTSVEGTIIVRELGEEVFKPIKFHYGRNNGEVDVDPNGKTGLDEGFFDDNKNEFKFSRITKTPFVFRDFHDVRVGLTKI